tara:strand:+ start:443 stop:781 length:339 start_codon:yes stop_codon:yes gene_type:complete
MDAGQLNSRIFFFRSSQTADGFGGFTTAAASSATAWAKYKQLDGAIEDENGIRERSVTAELICRKRDVKNIHVNDTFRVDSNTADDYRIDNIYESDYKYFVTIRGVLIDQVI